jgi:hypothetical protein
MRRSHALAILPFLFQLTTGVATAAERECMQYVPSVDKLVAVECEELRAAPAEFAAPAAAPPVAPAPVVAGRALEGADKLKKDVVELTDALTSAAGDTAFREAFCTLHATRQLLLQQKVRTEIARLQDQHVALQAKVGARGSLVRTALTEPVMGMLLGTPVDDAFACHAATADARGAGVSQGPRWDAAVMQLPARDRATQTADVLRFLR